jgi:hypothetical protein
MSNGWQNPVALDVPGGQQTQRLIEEMCNNALPMSADVLRAEALKLMAELERTKPDSPSLARAKAVLKAEAEEKKHGGKD